MVSDVNPRMYHAAGMCLIHFADTLQAHAVLRRPYHVATHLSPIGGVSRGALSEESNFPHTSPVQHPPLTLYQQAGHGREASVAHQREPSGRSGSQSHSGFGSRSFVFSVTLGANTSGKPSTRRAAHAGTYHHGACCLA
jgi:hypothetical protein